MKLSIIIPTKDRGKIFDQTLLSALEAAQHVDAEIVVVNDSKTSQPVIPNETSGLKLINNPRSGVASARNLGVRESDGEIILFLDDDIIISKESINQILSLHQTSVNACFNLNWEYPQQLKEYLEPTQFGRFMKAHGLDSFKGWYGDPSWKDDALFQSKSLASFHLSIFREDFRKTEGYDEQFTHAGFEDYDFPLRMKRAGLSFFIDARVTVFHNETDRVSLDNWLANQERRARTRHIAVTLGHGELKLEFGLIKKTFLKLTLALFTPVKGFLRIIPNHPIFDGLYFKLLSALVAAKIYRGYTAK